MSVIVLDKFGPIRPLRHTRHEAVIYKLTDSDIPDRFSAREGDVEVPVITIIPDRSDGSTHLLPTCRILLLVYYIDINSIL